MGVIEMITAVATTVTALIGVVYLVIQGIKKKRIEDYAKAEAELAFKIQSAKDEKERQRYAQELYNLRNGK